MRGRQEVRPRHGESVIDMTMAHPTYPVHVQGRLDRSLSRWLWLVKWLLALPHYVVLAFLWAAFLVLSVVAFFAILFTGRYPRTIFDFNVGVLRWAWRVAYYAYNALGTDRYPPFTLADVPDYPARLDIAYPEHLSRGLVLVKWWLLAIPHYIIVGIFVGGGAWVGWRADENWQWSWGGGGLVGLLVLISAVVLAVTGRYPRSLFDFILGMNRWALRVAGYAALMTDRYPPFRLDLGGDDPDGVLTLGRTATSPTGEAPEPPPIPTMQPMPAAPGTGTPGAPGPGGPVATSRWTTGRVIAVVVGALMVLTSAGFAAAGTGLAWAAGAQRDAAGYLTSDVVRLSTDGYAVTSRSITLDGAGPGWAYPDAVVDSVRLRAQGPASVPVFIGLGPTAQVEDYLASVQYSTVTDLGIGTGGTIRYTDHAGTAPAEPPASQGFWTAQSSGAGRQSVVWTPEAGDWTIVVMNADASPGVSVDTDVAADVPWLPWLGGGIFAAGIVLLLLGAALIAVAVARASRRESEALPRLSA